ncbi:unnamed protein product [Chrysodeixis includens]|uniref:Uncharacterized protein n=1 Tax=Chrysodeixis includens TaxID=689277 RepID=A0A9N8Q2L5_CHRIL|nr:unnamed protein product [Chrysodeixis includens]
MNDRFKYLNCYLPIRYQKPAVTNVKLQSLSYLMIILKCNKIDVDRYMRRDCIKYLLTIKISYEIVCIKGYFNFNMYKSCYYIIEIDFWHLYPTNRYYKRESL